MNKKMRKGFTLTELIIVIVIIGILAAVLIPTLTQYIGRSQLAADEEEAKSKMTVLVHDAILTKDTSYVEKLQGKVYIEGSRTKKAICFDNGAFVSTDDSSAFTKLTLGNEKKEDTTEALTVYHYSVTFGAETTTFYVNTDLEMVKELAPASAPTTLSGFKGE